MCSCASCAKTSAATARNTRWRSCACWLSRLPPATAPTSSRMWSTRYSKSAMSRPHTSSRRIIFGIFALKGFAGFGQDVLLNRISNNIIARYQKRVYDHMLHLGVSFYADQRSAALVSKIGQNISGIKGMMNLVITVVIRDFLTLAGLLVVMIVQDPMMTLGSMLVLPIAGYVLSRYVKQMKKLSRKDVNLNARVRRRNDRKRAGHRHPQVLHHGRPDEGEGRRARRHGRKAVQPHHARHFAHPAADRNARRHRDRRRGCLRRLARHCPRRGPGRAAVVPCRRDAGLRAGAPACGVPRPVRKVAGQCAHALRTARHAGPAGRQARRRSSSRPARREIVFDDVSFSYGNGEKVLDGVSFRAAPGKTTALVGPSGGGKSTIINLMQRFYDLEGGHILVDGQDIADVKVASLRRSHRLCLAAAGPVRRHHRRQHPLCAAPRRPTPRSRRRPGRRRPMTSSWNCPGVTTREVGEMGNNFSGGQRQRLSIARAIVRNAPILLLDEATSALDNESEKLVQGALDTLMKGRTTIVIAHRLSTIRDAHTIVVIDRGKVVEQGSHATLDQAPHRALFAPAPHWRGTADGLHRRGSRCAMDEMKLVVTGAGGRMGQELIRAIPGHARRRARRRDRAQGSDAIGKDAASSPGFGRTALSSPTIRCRSLPLPRACSTSPRPRPASNSPRSRRRRASSMSSAPPADARRDEEKDRAAARHAMIVKSGNI